MAGEIRQFSAESTQRIADVVRQVEGSPIVRNEPGGGRPSPQARVLRWARTTTNYDYPTYPTSGPAYVVEFGDYGISPDPVYPGATVSKSFTAYSPQVTVVAVDPDGGSHEEGSVVRIERHGPDWWIRPAAGAAVEGVMFWDAIARGYGATYPRGGAYVGSEYYTFDYQKVRGDYAANHITPLDAYSAGLPFVEVDQTGAYELSMDVRFVAFFNGTVDQTYTTSTPSTGTVHTHTVTAWRGGEMFANVVMQLQYQVGGSGSWTTVPNTPMYVSALSSDGGYQTGEPIARISGRRIVNLTAGWALRQQLSFIQIGSLSDHVFQSANAESLLMRYLGEPFADTSM